MSVSCKRHAHYAHVLVALLLLLVALTTPRAAYAQSFSVGPVSIDATVSADGTVHVAERRTYTFDGSFKGVYWAVPQGAYEGRTVTAQIESVRATADGTTVQFQPGTGGAAGTYEQSQEEDCIRLKIFYPAESQVVLYEVEYALTSAASRWADTAELYWQYLPVDPSSQGEWTDVTATVHLPVPDGAAIVPGDNVRAWGHGPIDGEVVFEGTTVRLFSPGVGSEEFLEVRVAFPQEWLGDAPASSEARLESIMAEEDQWAREANARRWKARLTAYGFPVLMCLAGVGSVVATRIHSRRRSTSEPKPRFTDKYYRDVPSADHPAVLGMLYRDGRIDTADLSATLMRLNDQGWIALDAVKREVADERGKLVQKQDWRLVRRDAVKKADIGMSAGGKAIDDAAMSFVFDVVGTGHKRTQADELQGSSNAPYAFLSDFAVTAQKWPTLYDGGYTGWVDAVRNAYAKRRFETKKEDDLFYGLLGLGDFTLAVAFAVIGMFLGVPNILLCIAFIVWFGAGLYIIMADSDTPTITYSQEAVDLRAQLAALKRWLEDFTRLEEAIPTDVVLWNRLLVMATVFGVADKVVKQLRVHVPEMLTDPAFGLYTWFDSGTDKGFAAPAAALKGAIPSSGARHEVSTSGASSSRSSSSRGSGGGFSSGGGGGFSGGGRGGAF